MSPRTIPDAVPPGGGLGVPRKDEFAVCVLGHLRAVKDPLRTAAASRLLPASSRIRVVQVGGALSPDESVAARAEESANPRYQWLGDRPRAEALAVLSRSLLLVVSSRAEGGANVISEALAAQVPILCSRIDGTAGILGDDYPGYFPVGDTGALAVLLARAETDPAFYGSLVRACAAARPLVDPARERESWRLLLDEIDRHRRIGTVAVDPGELARDVTAGLDASPRRLDCRYFYDPDGSRLFEEICGLPEYYLTRAEHEILAKNAGEIVGRLPRGTRLIELGSGSAVKTRLLIEALIHRQGSLQYQPIDISESALEESTWRLLADFPSLTVTAVAAEYEAGLHHLGAEPGPKLVLWLGSNIGNLDRAAAAAFLRRLRAHLTAEDRLLIGIDLRKPREVLEPAYDDARGVTAEFNRNLLYRINRELGGHFDPAAFHHRARWDELQGRIDMYLVSSRAQEIAVDALGRRFAFAEGEAIHTESSYKYSFAEIDQLAAVAGLELETRWLDAAAQFSENRFRRGEGASP